MIRLPRTKLGYLRLAVHGCGILAMNAPSIAPHVFRGRWQWLCYVLPPVVSFATEKLTAIYASEQAKEAGPQWPQIEERLSRVDTACEPAMRTARVLIESWKQQGMVPTDVRTDGGGGLVFDWPCGHRTLISADAAHVETFMVISSGEVAVTTEIDDDNGD